MSTPAKICLVTPGHVGSTPRLVKEADALAAAGYDVRVVAARHFPPVDPLDMAVMGSAAWRCVRVDATGRAKGRLRSVLRRLAQAMVSRLENPGTRLAAFAQDSVSPAIQRAAAAEAADLYIGHCMGALPAVACAAAAHRARYGFDIEDYHDGETPGAMANPALVKATRLLQSRLLPGARYLTASAPLIAEKYEEAYRVRASVVLNVFPRSEAPPSPVKAPRISESSPAVLYWFSQTIGAERGLEEMLRVTARMRTPAVLHLRGFVSDGFRRHLLTVASDAGARPPVFLPPANPQEMARLSASAHAGICSELPTVPNRHLCLANKIFTYLLAGVPVLLSPTRAHAALSQSLGEAARVLPLAEPEAAAAIVDALLGSDSASAGARMAAWKLAQGTYCWDKEKDIVLRDVAAALAAPR